MRRFPAFDRRNNPLPQVHAVRLAHPIFPTQSQRWNQLYTREWRWALRRRASSPSERDLRQIKPKTLHGLPLAVRRLLEQLPAAAHPMDVMRSGVSAMECMLPEGHEGNVVGRRACRFCAVRMRIGERISRGLVHNHTRLSPDIARHTTKSLLR
jgi:citrate synthase